MVFGIVFVLVGLLGFFDNPIVGMSGFFQTDLLHNLVHLIVGVVLLGVAMMAAEQSALALKVFGVVYLLVAVLGFVATTDGKILGLITANTWDHYLHIVLGVVLIAAGFMGNKQSSSMPMAGQM